VGTRISVEIPGITDPEILYHYQLGVFHGVWGTVDVTIDFAIGKFMSLPHEDALMITWGMMFGTKAKLLSNLIKKSHHPKKHVLTTAFNAIKGLAKRDIVAHGYQIENPTHVGFLEKARGGGERFSAKLHVFTREEFARHVDKLIGDANAFYDALDAPPEEFDAFVEAAKSFSSKS
jgi:hypothetical protein